jgi:hypothetical protein
VTTTTLIAVPPRDFMCSATWPQLLELIAPDKKASLHAALVALQACHGTENCWQSARAWEPESRTNVEKSDGRKPDAGKGNPLPGPRRQPCELHRGSAGNRGPPFDREIQVMD